MIKEDAERLRIEFLLPWYAAGTLSCSESNRVEKALAGDIELARRYALVLEELAETINLNEALGEPSASVAERLFAAIDAEEARTAVGGGFIGLRRHGTQRRRQPSQASLNSARRRPRVMSGRWRATAWTARLGRIRRLAGGPSDSVPLRQIIFLSLFRSIRPFACIAREIEMLLKRKNAVIYGAGGAVGGAVARTFAREGANVFLAGRRLEFQSVSSPRRSLPMEALSKLRR